MYTVRTKWQKSILFLFFTIASIAFLPGCVFMEDDENSGLTKYEYDYTNMVLRAYFIFQERLPDSSAQFPSPVELYKSVNEPWTVYYPRKDAKEFLAYFNTNKAGIGIRLDSLANGYLIKDVFPNSPASNAKLQKKDTLIQVGSISVVNLKWSNVSDLLRGNAGDTRELKVKRGSNDTTCRVTLGTFKAPTVFFDSLSSKAAYLALDGFLSNTNTVGGSATEFSNAMDSTKWAEYTILDLQQNGGGELDQCMSIVSELVPVGTSVIRFRQRSPVPNQENRFETRDSLYITSKGGKFVNRKFIMLVDSFTASASEILVSCIKTTNPTTPIIGTRTYGKARAQIYGLTPDSGIAKVTYATLTPPSSASYDSVGIMPTIKASSSDIALDLALKETEEAALTKVALKKQKIKSLLQLRKEFLGNHKTPLAIEKIQ